MTTQLPTITAGPSAADGTVEPAEGTVEPADGREAGFTLLEVMVVVMIIGILLAIGIPTFLGARTRAQDRAAQSTDRIAQSAAMVVFADYADFAQVTTARVRAAEPGLTWVAGNVASTNEQTASAGANSTGTEWGAAARSDSGECFYIRLRKNNSTLYGRSTTATCTGDSALTRATASSW